VDAQENEADMDEVERKLRERLTDEEYGLALQIIQQPYTRIREFLAKLAEETGVEGTEG
jgi:hypothetical protein